MVSTDSSHCVLSVQTCWWTLAPCQLTNRQSKRNIGMNGLEGGIFLLMYRIYMWGSIHGLIDVFETIIRQWIMGMVDGMVEQQWYIGLQMDRLLANPSSRHVKWRYWCTTKPTTIPLVQRNSVHAPYSPPCQNTPLPNPNSILLVPRTCPENALCKGCVVVLCDLNHLQTSLTQFNWMAYYHYIR